MQRRQRASKASPHILHPPPLRLQPLTHLTRKPIRLPLKAPTQRIHQRAHDRFHRGQQHLEQQERDDRRRLFSDLERKVE